MVDDRPSGGEPALRCPQCDADVAEGDAFCSSCGAAQPDNPEAIPARSGRALAFFLALVINAALFAGSAYAVYRVLTARQEPTPRVRLGLPRQVAETPLVFEWPSWWRYPLGVRGRTLTYPPGDEDGSAAAPPTASRHRRDARRGHRRHHRRHATRGSARGSGSGARASSGKVGGRGWTGAGAGSADGSDHGGAPGAATGAGSASGASAAAGSGSGSVASSAGSGSALSPLDQRRAEFDAGSIRLVVRQHLPQIQACYLRALKRKRNIRGDVDIALVLRGDGTPKSATVHSNTTGHEGLGKCIAYNMARWRYPRPVSGKESRFIYPFAFAPSENP